MEVMTFS